jgi:putative phosphoribosyl transferase
MKTQEASQGTGRPGNEVRIPVGETHLAGELNVPTGARGMVVFVHGSGSSRFSPRNQFVARMMRAAGQGTLLFDLLTRSEELMDNQTAALRFDIDLLAQRLAAATFWVKNEPDIRHLPIGYFGSSTSGAAALVTAAKLGLENVAAVVSRGGRPDLAGVALTSVTSPTLLIVGECDDGILRLNREAYDSLRCEKDLKIVSHATHLFEEPGALEEVAHLAAAWFSRHLRGNPQS